VRDVLFEDRDVLMLFNPPSTALSTAIEGTRAGGGAEHHGARNRNGQRPPARHEYRSIGRRCIFLGF
jgi:hypothetical protein